MSGRGAVSKIGMTLAVRLETVRLSGSPVWIHERLDHQVEITRENIQHHSGSYDTEMVSPQDHGSHGIFDIHGQGYLLGRDWSLGSWTWDQAERKCSGGLRPPSLFPKDVPRDGCDPWTMWSCSTRLSSVRHRVMSGIVRRIMGVQTKGTFPSAGRASNALAEQTPTVYVGGVVYWGDSLSGADHHPNKSLEPDSNQRPKDFCHGFTSTVLRSTN